MYEHDNTWCEKYLPVIKQRFTDSFIQMVMADINAYPKGIFYKHIVDHFTLPFYLCKPTPSLSSSLVKCRVRTLG